MLINTWQFWVIVYLISTVSFSQSFKVTNRNMKNAGSLTVLLEVFTGIVSLLMMPVFDFKFSPSSSSILLLLVVVFIYAITDRLNIEVRYGLDTSTFSVLKRLSTVFMIIFGFLFLNEEIILNKILGAIVIILANIMLTYDKGKFRVNKYFIMGVISNFLFAIAMVLNVDISSNYNLAFYTYITVTGPAILISLIGHHTIKDLKEEFNLYNKKYFIISACTWAIMLNSSIRAYQLGSVTIVASLFSLTPILNALCEVIFFKDRSNFLKKIIVSILLIIGVVLVNL